MKKTVFSMFLVLVLLMGMVLPAGAADDKAVRSADYLHSLGLFNGVGTDAAGKPIYDLDRAPTRQEAVTMLIRLLGKEAEALSGSWQTPFTDVDDWAAAYVGYAYEKGLTKGTGETTFGGNETVSATQYITFILRALGYESETDFAWDSAWDRSDALGITDGTYSASNNGAFRRGDVVIVSASALSAKTKDGRQTLLELLKKQGAVGKEAEVLQKPMEEQYLDFARMLMNTEGEPCEVAFSEDGKLTWQDLDDYFGQYDIYRGIDFGLTTADPHWKEKLLVSCLKDYAGECVDGDYSTAHAVNFTIKPNTEELGALMFTNRMGTVTGIGFLEPGMQSVTFVQCAVDSRELMNRAARSIRDMIASLTEVACTFTEETGVYTYQFSDLPSNAVWMSWNRSSNSMGKGDVQEGLYNAWSLLRNGFRDKLVPVSNPYVTTTLSVASELEHAYSLYVFCDSNYNLVGYTVVSNQ